MGEMLWHLLKTGPAMPNGTASRESVQPQSLCGAELVTHYSHACEHQLELNRHGPYPVWSSAEREEPCRYSDLSTGNEATQPRMSTGVPFRWVTDAKFAAKSRPATFCPDCLKESEK